MRAFPDRVAKFAVLTLHTDADPVNVAERPFTVLVNGVTLPEVMS